MTSTRFKVHNIINIAGKYFYPNEKSQSKHQTLCEEFIIKLYQNTVIILIMILVSYGIAALSGLYAIIFVDPRYTLMGTEIPFVNSSTTMGYAILMSYQFFIALVSLLSNITIEIGVCLVYNAFALMPELIRLRSDELNSELELNGPTNNATVRLRNICLQVHDFNMQVFIEHMLGLQFSCSFVDQFLGICKNVLMCIMCGYSRDLFC